MNHSRRQEEKFSSSSSSSSWDRRRPPTSFISSFNPFATAERDENFPDFDQAISIRTTRNNDSFVDENNRSTASNGSTSHSMLSISVRAALAEHNRHIAVHGIDPDVSSLQASDEEKAVTHHHHHNHPSRDPRDIEWERLLNSSRASCGSVNNNANNSHIYAEGETIEVSTNVSDFFNSSQVLKLSTPEHSRNVNYAEPTRRNECYSEHSFSTAASDDDDDSHHRMQHMVRLATTTMSETSNNQVETADESCEAFANVDISRISADGSCQLESPLRHNQSLQSHDPLEFTNLESPKRKKDRLQPYTIGTASSSPFSSPSRGSRLASPRTKLHNSSNSNHTFAPSYSKWTHQTTTTPPRPRQLSRSINNSPPSANVEPDDIHLGQLGLSPISKKAADLAHLMLQSENWKQAKQSAVAAVSRIQSFPDESLSFEQGPISDKNSFSGFPFSSNVLEQTDQQLPHTQLATDSISPLQSSSSEQKHSRSTERSELKKSSLSSISPNSSSEHHVTTKKSSGESSSLSKSTPSSGNKLLAGTNTTTSRPPRPDNDSSSIHCGSSSSVHSAFDPTDRRRFRTVVPMRAYMTEPSEFPLEDDSFSTTSFSIPNFSTPFTGTDRLRQEIQPQRQWKHSVERECHSAPGRTSVRATNEADIFIMSPVLRERLFLHQSR